MKIKELDEKVQAKLHQLAGLMDIQDVHEFESLEHFISEVMSRVSQSISLAEQISKVLRGR